MFELVYCLCFFLYLVPHCAYTYVNIYYTCTFNMLGSIHGLLVCVHAVLCIRSCN